MKLCKCGCGKEIKEGNEFIKGHYWISHKHTQLSKNKIKENHINCSGKNNAMYGKHHTEESKQKILEKNLGKIGWNKGLTKENDERMKKQSEKIKNVSKSEEHKQKLRENHANVKKENNPFFGKHHTEESNIKNSLKHKQLYSKKENHPRYGSVAAKGVGRGKGCHYNSPLQGKIWLRSSYELAYAKYLDSTNVPYYYEIQTFDLRDTTYTPDFFLPETNEFIEIKGFMSNNNQEKIDRFIEIYHCHSLKILYKEDLINLGIKL